MKLSLLTTVILTIAGVVACAPKKSSIQVKPASVNVHHYANAGDAKLAQRGWRVECASTADCPDSVAQMVALSDSDVTTCTATLVSPDLMLTNSHCLDDKTKTADELCKATHFVFAATSASGPEDAKCKAVVLKSKLVAGAFNQADVMVLRLEHALKRNVSAISRAGLQHHQILALAKVDPVGAAGGRLKISTCKILQGTAFLPNSIHATDPVMDARDCDIIDGNSGSPLLTDKGEVAAIAFASVSHYHDEVTKVMSQLGSDQIEAKTHAVMMARVTNLSCLELPPPLASAPSSCSSATLAFAAQAASKPDLDAHRNWPRIATAMREAAHPYSSLIDQKIGFHALLAKDQTAVYLAPYCFNSASGSADSATIKAVIIKWKLAWTLDDDLKAVPQLKEAHPPELRTMAFSPATLQKTAQSPVKDLASGAMSTWPVCARHVPTK